MNIIIIGAGAIGSYIGVNLARAGQRVTFVVRPHRVSEWQDQQMTLIAGDETIQITPYVSGSVQEAIEQTGRCDLLILAVKSYDLPDVIADLATHLDPIPMILATQNGIGVESQIAAVFGAKNVLASSVTVPVKVESPTTLRIERNKGGLAVAPVRMGADIRKYVDVLVAAGIPASTADNYESMKWSKAILNILANAASAILNWTPSQIYSHAQLFDQEMAMLNEALAVMQAKKLPVINLPSAPSRQVAFAAKRLPQFLRKRVFQYAVGTSRGNKMPSFNLDLMAGKRKNEVRFHNVAIARHGQQLGVPTPVNSALGDILMKLVTKQLPRNQFENKPEALLEAVAAHVEQPSVLKIGSSQV